MRYTSEVHYDLEQCSN